MKKIIVKTIATFICLFFILEFSLFLTGKFLLFLRWKKYEPKDSVVKIACIGDSHTFGVGTSCLYAYPAQLGKLLNDNNTQKFEIYNLGVPGASTREQAGIVENFLKDKNIAIVIMLTGRNNEHEAQKFYASGFRRNMPDMRFLRSVRFLGVLLRQLFAKNEKNAKEEISSKHRGYLNFYLNVVKNLCNGKKIKLVLLSYYNSRDEAVEEFARKNKIPYFDFTSDFDILFKQDERKRYVSLDNSHLNSLGYKCFAEHLYEQLFLNQGVLGISINPLLRKYSEADLYSKKEDVATSLKRQEERLDSSINSGSYPNELIHLGHIYLEIGEKESARQYYEKAIAISGYRDNNTIIAPLINWYITEGNIEKAFAVCEGILSHNPANKAAKAYYEWLQRNKQPAQD